MAIMENAMESVKPTRTIRPMYPYQLAKHACVSRRTMSKWIHDQREPLAQRGYSTQQRILPPSAILYLCEFYCIDL